MRVRHISMILSLSALSTFGALDGGGKGGGGGSGTCSGPIIVSSPSDAFQRLDAIANVAVSQDGTGIGKNDETKAISFSLAENLRAMPLANNEMVLAEKIEGVNFNTFRAYALQELASVALKKPFGYVDASSGFYTAAMLQKWVKSLSPTEVFDLVSAKQFRKVRILALEKLSPQEKISLNSSSHAACSHFLAIDNEGAKSLECLNFSTSQVTCRANDPLYTCSFGSVKQRIGAYMQYLTVAKPTVLPYAGWATQLNELFAEGKKDTNTLIHQNMIFYTNSQGGISCALKASDGHASIASLASYNGKKWLKVPTHKEKDYCGVLYRMSAYNTAYEPVTIITDLSSETLNVLDGTAQSQGDPQEETLASLGFAAAFNQEIAKPIGRYTLNHSVLNFSGDLLNAKLLMKDIPKTAAVLSLVQSCSAGGGGGKGGSGGFESGGDGFGVEKL